HWFGAEHPDWATLPRHFKNNGYVSAHFGKIFHGGIDDTEAWTEGGEPRNFTGPVNTAKKGQVPSESDRINILPGNGESHIDFRTATRTIEFLEKHKDDTSF